ncbi:putative disease resistance RPP13-like protein 3 [Dichanthelium oligosanthes]|uniref:Putative disease resistance RPP13-like protein 3 n=1 Tax=Dichanthelium oligosanthes TaxID=888268 RepID=A0A1E5UTA0_9POAL|nr:putative disease resistance RPP13-like protein 3 [Dichanthelium oligosanthes]
MESAAQTIVTNVGQLLAEEYRQLRGVSSEVAELRDDLATMNALLRMQAEADEGAVDHFVREWMKQLRELAYDTEDCVDLYKLRIKCRRSDNLCAWIKHMFETLFPRRRLAGEIKVLRARAIAISERHMRYGVNREALRRSPILSSSLPLMAASAHALRRANNDPAGQHQFIGIGKQAVTLAELVKKASSAAGKEHHRLKVFSIVGFGGVGKTTLAMDLCRQLVADFPCQAMVSVSQAFEPSRDLKPLLKRVLQQDSRIVVTTRIETVAEACSPPTVNGHYIHHMKPLDPNDSKKLFLSRVFGSMDAESCPEDLRDVMDEILKKCGGLPLAIVSIASILAAYRSPGSSDKWKTISKSIGSQMESHPTLEGMKQIVTLSYSHLPHELKGCMLYLSIFPEDYEINKNRLLCRWIAEGLVHEKRGLTIMEVAESYLDQLLSRNMIEPRFGLDGKVDSCKMHDMLLEVMVSRSLESNFVSLHGGQYAGMSYDRIRRLSIQGGDNRMTQHVDHGLLDPPSNKKKKILQRRRKKHSIEDMDLEHARSLSMFQLKGHKLLDQLDKFTLLRVLDLEDCEGITNDHLKIVCRMYLLKFLNLRNTNISEVPPQVGNLEHLQTFDVSQTKLRGLPETVTSLEKVERIVFSNKDHWEVKWRMPRGISKMKALREMEAGPLLGNDVHVAREVGELDKLQKLTIYIDSYEKICTEVLGELAKSLSKAHSLRSLNIGDLGYTDILKFLHDLTEPPRLLRYFRITGDMSARLPTWIGSLTYLVEVAISFTNLTGDEPFCMLCNLPNLKSITMEQQYYDGKELVARTIHNFPALIILTMSSSVNNNEMPEVFGFEDGSMSKLEKLKINFGKYNRSIVGIEHLTNLKEVQLIGQKDNTRLSCALDQLKAENGRRGSSNQFQIVVKYQAVHKPGI